MRTTIEIDDALMRKAMRLSGLTRKKAVVEAWADNNSAREICL
jgi:Arc/MetJ family transcription regulator